MSCFHRKLLAAVSALTPAGCPMTAVGTGEQVEMLLNFFDIALFPQLFR